MQKHNITKKEIEDAYKRCGTLQGTAVDLGIHRTTLRKYIKRMNIETKKQGIDLTKEQLLDAYNKCGSATDAAVLLGVGRETFTKYWNMKVGVSLDGLFRQKKRKFADVEQIKPPIEESVNVDDEKLINEMQERGYFVTKAPKRQDYTFTPSLTEFEGETIKVGIVSDTHLCSRYQQLTHLHSFYELCKKRGIEQIFHAGDITDGQSVYKGHEFELFLHGADAQVDYCVKNYPKVDGIKTIFVCGNHDESHWNKAGVDVGKAIAKRRKDMKYLGFHGAYIALNGNKKAIYLHHGAGGCAYARSYKIQKLIEQFSPDQKPYMLFVGHYHVSNWLPMYRNVSAWTLPCFQGQTSYLKRRGLYPELGGLIMEFVVGKNNKPILPKFEFVPFYVPKNDDY